MKTRRTILRLPAFMCLCALVALWLATGVSQAQNTPAYLTIHADQPVAKVSPTLYGLMTEEINHSYEGGLYSELIQNGTFRSDWSGILDWYLVQGGSSVAKISEDRTAGLSAALPYSLHLEVDGASPKSPAGILNDGFWGIPVRPNTTYHGSIYAKADTTEIGPVTVSLVADQSGRVLASAVISDVGTTWADHRFTLKTGEIDGLSTANHFELTVAHAGSLWMNLATLFPPSYHDRANGTRIDLMQKLAAMHPAFLRFPGGNFLEGNQIADWYDWKKTVGPLVNRPGHASPWGYWSTDGFGLLEFLEWCEDLHMQPVLAVYAGYSLRGEHVTPGPDLEPYVQSALDEIEYATGGADTTWGSRRVADGHPEPFQMTYVEIGNEDQFDRSGSYDARFAQFAKAIRAKYPELQLIATAPVTSEKPDVLDEHYYLRASQFFDDVGHYDKTDRNGPKIFVGEWATREGTPTPNLGAALGDAAWMTGLERNSDVIVMASYAPLLVNVNPGASQWVPDLIGYDALRSYGSPSYYAQVMFASRVGDMRPASEVNGGGPRFFSSVTEDTAGRRLFIKLVNASSDLQPVKISLPGVSAGPDGQVTVLSGRDTQATNTIDHPANIVPVDKPLAIAGNSLTYDAPAYSIQVLDVPLTR
jgi:alpha-L-arabinofuranosidase